MKAVFSTALVLGLAGSILADPAVPRRPGPPHVRQQITVNTDTAGRAQTDIGPTTRSAGVSETGTQVEYIYAQPYSEDGFGWRLGIAGEYRRFEGPDGMWLPEEVGGVNAVIGGHWAFGRDWMFRVEGRPGFYSDFHDTRLDAFNIPLLMLFTHPQSPKLIWTFGMLVNPRSDIPVLPGLGVVWRPAERWNILAIFPAPRITYTAAKTLDLFAGIQMQGGSYRVARDFGSKRGNPDLDGRTLDTREWRWSTGFGWTLLPWLKFETAGGMVFKRTYSFRKSDTTLHGAGAPFVELNLRGSFL